MIPQPFATGSIIVIALLIASVILVGLIWLITDYYVEFIKEEEEPVPPILSWKLDTNTIQMTNELEKAIDRLIEFETFSELITVKALEQKYDVRELDKGVKNISTRVYEYLNPDIFDTAYFIKSDHIMHYIVSRTRSFFISSVIEHNNKTP